MTRVPQVDVKPYSVMRFCVKNQGTRIWFKHEIDLMGKKGNGLQDMSNEINDKCNKFAFLVFKKIEEETNSWLKGNDGSRYRADIRDVHDQAHKIKDEIQQKHNLFDKKAGEYEKQVPVICVSVEYNFVHITSDDWFDVFVGKSPPIEIDVSRLHDQIKDRFRVFYTMVYGKLGREIRNTLRSVEKAFFGDKWLITVKTNFDQKMTVPILNLKEWIGHHTETDSTGSPNTNPIPGMDVLVGRDLTMPGPFAQTYATKMFQERNIVKVLGVENHPERPPGKNPHTGNPYDADIWLECDGEKVPIQVGVREGELARKVSDTTVYPGEKIQPNEAVSELGGTNIDYGKKPDFVELCKKLGQVPPGGVVLWVSSKELLPGSGPRPLKEWYGEVMDKKCVIMWFDDYNAVIHHNNTGFDLTLARKLCTALGVDNPGEQTDSEESLTEDYARSGAEGVLRHLAYMSEYLGRRSDDPVVPADDLVPILRHVVEMQKKSVANNADDGRKWRRYMSKALSMLEDMSKTGTIKLDSNVWIEICHVLQDIASRRYDNYVCKILWIDEIYKRLHLEALFCLTYVVIYRLGDKTPPEVLETLTAAAKLAGQEGKEHRIVLGSALWVGLRSAISDWYAENESLLFGKDSPDGMNSTLMRVCAYDSMHIRTDIAHPVLDVQTMEKYHTVVLEALDEEMRHVRSREPETGERVKTNDFIRHFMRHVLHGSHGYVIRDSVRDLASIGPDALSMAGHECGFLIRDKNTEEKLVERAVQFWETVLDLSPEPAALYGFGWWMLVKSVDPDTWERLMLRTCEVTSGLVESPASVIDRVSSDGKPTELGVQIIELVLRANKHLLNDLAVLDTLSKMQKNGVSIDI